MPAWLYLNIMWRRILSFLGWLWAGFCFIGALGGVVSGELVAAIGVLIWGLIFLPPLYRFTSSFGRGWNIGGRILVFILVPLVFPAPSQQQANQPPIDSEPPVITKPANIETESPTFTPITRPTPTLESTPIPVEPDIAPAPEIVKTPEPEPVTEPEPGIVNTPKPKPPQNIPEPDIAPAPNPNAAVRASVSGSCDCPYDTDSRGRSCGKRSAYSRPGGRSPICYVRDRQ